jgi:PCI domain
LNVRVSAYRADDAAGSLTGANAADTDADAEKQEADKYCKEASQKLQSLFRKMIISRSSYDVSSKMGCLFLVVHMFKIYFRVRFILCVCVCVCLLFSLSLPHSLPLCFQVSNTKHLLHGHYAQNLTSTAKTYQLNNLRLCTNLIKSVDSPNFPPIHMFPKSEIVTYKYYYGRLMLFEERYGDAAESLDESLRMCHPTALRNKRRILEFLIPVKMILGTLPSQHMLAKYSMYQFQNLVKGVRSGNLKLFNESILRHQDFFIERGIFLILEKLKMLVYRNLFKKVHVVWKAETTEAKEASRLRLHVLQKGLAINGVDIDNDELECIVANLIFEGRMKGYIAHGNCVVVSKTDPFPTVSRG